MLEASWTFVVENGDIQEIVILLRKLVNTLQGLSRNKFKTKNDLF